MAYGFNWKPLLDALVILDISPVSHNYPKFLYIYNRQERHI